MNSPRLLTARNAAWKTLNKCNIIKHDTAEVLDPLLSRCDRGAQATDIVYGVIRHRGTIDRILTKCATLDPARVKPSQWNLLRIGVYELVYAYKTADYAILNEATRLAVKAGSRKAAGFINAVLRNVQRAITNRNIDLEQADIRCIVPQTKSTGCAFNIQLLPDPQIEPTQYLCTAFSLPQDLINQWLNAYGYDQTRSICCASNRSPSMIVWPNLLQTTLTDLTKQLQNENIEWKKSDNVLRIRGTGKINKLKIYRDGLFFIQDSTAAAAIETLSPEPNWTVLDLCAGPGGKCTAAAIRMQDKGVILASDIDTKRLQKVRENARRMQLESIEIVPANRIEQTVRKLKKLDAIVLDVPCSNTGVLARRIEARWRWKPRHVNSLRNMQGQLLDKAAEISRPQTKILYSTCSIQPGENQLQIQEFLARNKKFRLLDEKLTLPSVQTPQVFDHDGGYAAVIKEI